MTTYQHGGSSVSQVPQGCECQETEAALKDCEVFVCECICDLTAGACDANCCCDSECTADQVTEFERDNACAADGASVSVAHMCYSAKSLTEVNPTFPMSALETTEDVVGKLLCVEWDRSESRGSFYNAPPDTIDSDTLDSYMTYTYYQDPDRDDAAQLVDLVEDGTTQLKDSYIAGLGIPVKHCLDGPLHTYDADGQPETCQLEGDEYYEDFLRLPAADMRGECNENNYAHFEVNVAGTTCARQVLSTTLADECEAVFGFARFGADLRVYDNPGGNLINANEIDVVVTSVLHTDGTDLTAQFVGDTSTDTARRMTQRRRRARTHSLACVTLSHTFPRAPVVLVATTAMM
jgi:hypothetical protein